MTLPKTTLSEEDILDLQSAYKYLEHPSLAIRLSSALGTPIETGLELLPKYWQRWLDSAVEFSIRKTLDVAITSMGQLPTIEAHNRLHKLIAIGSGVIGGIGGPVALLAELPITTAVMLRAIADIAHSQGEDLSTLESRFACMQVFALGGRSLEDDAADTGYYGLRITLGFHFSRVASFASGGGSTNIPAVIDLVRAIATRFGIAVSDKAAVQMIPVAGALSGGALNLIFMQHFQDMALGHFTVRRLERKYGAEAIKIEYERLTHEDAKTRKAFSDIEGW